MIRHACVTISVHEGGQRTLYTVERRWDVANEKAQSIFILQLQEQQKKRGVERQLSKVRDKALDIKVFFSWLQL